MKSNPTKRRWGCAVFAAACLLIGAFVLRPVIRNAQEAARRTQCRGDLPWLRSCLRNYVDAFGTLPPAVIRDDNGRPMHSWRVLLMDHNRRSPWGYDDDATQPKYRFDEPWDSPNNRKLESTYHQVFACESDPGSHEFRRANYVAVVGENTLWPPTGPRDFGDLENPHAQYAEKILLIELPDSDIHWMEPRDITFDEAISLFSAPNGLKATRHIRTTSLWDPPQGLYYITYGGRCKSMQTIRDATHFAELLEIGPMPDVEP